MQAHPRCERCRKQQAETLSLLASRSHLLGLKVIHACHQLHTELSLYGAQRMNSKRVPGESEGQSADSTSKVGRRPRPRNREHERASRGREICASQIIWEGLLSSSSARAAVEQRHRPGGGLKQQKCSVSRIRDQHSWVLFRALSLARRRPSSLRPYVAFSRRVLGIGGEA